jgi:hypothetical protein
MPLTQTCSGTSAAQGASACTSVCRRLAGPLRQPARSGRVAHQFLGPVDSTVFAGLVGQDAPKPSVTAEMYTQQAVPIPLLARSSSDRPTTASGRRNSRPEAVLAPSQQPQAGSNDQVRFPPHPPPSLVGARGHGRTRRVRGIDWARYGDAANGADGVFCFFEDAAAPPGGGCRFLGLRASRSRARFAAKAPNDSDSARLRRAQSSMSSGPTVECLACLANAAESRATVSATPMTAFGKGKGRTRTRGESPRAREGA